MKDKPIGLHNVHGKITGKITWHWFTQCTWQNHHGLVEALKQYRDVPFLRY